MPRENAPETGKVADAVAKSTAEASAGLRGVADAAKSADGDIGKFSATQAEAARIAGKFAEAMDNAAKSATGLGKATADARGVAASLGEVTSESEKAATALEKARQAARAQASQANTLSQEMDGVASASDLVRKSLLRGRQEAEAFGGGLLKNGAGALAAGAGIVFLTQKLGDLVGKYMDAAKALASFNVQQALSAKQTLGIDASGLEELRDELNLTKEQSANFFEALKDGGQSGVVSISELTMAAGKLRDAYGGDPTEKLKDFIALVKEIPTLEADISVTASVDDQAASIFALAKAGKIDALIQAQGAGLLGGAAPGVESKDVEMLNEQQKALKVQENIQDAIIGKLVPPISSHLPVIAGAVTGTLNVLGSILGLAGGLQLLFQKRQVSAQKETTKAVKQLDGMGGGVGAGAKGFDFKKLLPGLKRIGAGFKRGGIRGATQAGLRSFGSARASAAFKRGGFTGLAKASKAGTMFGGAVKSVLPTLKTFGAAAGGIARTMIAAGGPLALVSLGLGLAGKAASWVSEQFEKAGNETGAATAKFGAEVLGAGATIAGFAAAGAAFGSVIPGLGTAVGAATGAIIGVGVALWNSGDDIKDAADGLAEVLWKDGTSIVSKGLGAVIKGFGMVIKGASMLIKAPFKAIGATAKFIGTALSEFGSRIYDNIFYSKEEANARREARNSLRAFNKTMKKALEPNEELSEAQARANQVTTNSAMSLQRALQNVESTSKGATSQLAQMEGELAGIDMKFLREVGGTAEEFDRAIKMATNASVEEFEQMNKSIRASRETITRMDDLTAQDRQAALNELRKIELEAAQKFADGISEIIEGLLTTPEIVTSELKKNISGQRLDFGAETGAFGIDEFLGEAQNAVDAAGGSLEATFKQLEAIEKASEARRKAFEEATRESRESLKDLAVGLPAATKEALAEMNVNLGADLSLEDAKKAAEAIRAEMEKADKEIEGITEGLAFMEGDGVRGLSSYAKGVNDEIEAAKEGVNNAAKALEGVKRGTEEYRNRAESLKKAQEELAAAEAKRGDAQDKIRAYLAKQTKDADVIAAVEASLLGDKEKLNAISKRNKAAIDKAERLVDGIIDGEEGAVEKLEDRTDLVEKQAKLAQAVSIVEEIVNAQRSEAIKELEDQQKIEAMILQRTTEINALINKIAGEAGKEARQAQRRLRVTESQANFAAATGDAQEQILRQNQENLALAKAEIASVDKRRKFLDEQRKKYDQLLAAAESEQQRKLYEGVIENLDEQSAELEIAANEAKDRIISAFDAMEEVINSFMQQPVGRQAQAGLDLREANFELTQFSDATRDAFQANTQEAIKNAKIRADVQRQGVEAFLKNAEAAATQLRELGKVDEADAMLTTAQAEARAKYAKIETEEAQTQLDTIKKATDVRMGELEIQERINSSALDIAQTFSGSADAIKGPLAEALRLEKERLAILEKEAADTRKEFGESKATREAEAAVIEQSAKVRQQEVQNVRDIAAARQRELDIQGGIADIAVDIAETFDGAASAIEGPLKAALQVEKNRLATLRTEYEDLKAKGVEGVELEEKGLEISRKEADIRKQELDIVERIAAARMVELDIQAESAGIAREIAEAFDGSAATMKIAMERELSVEQDKLAELQRQKQELITAGKGGQAIRQKELEIYKQEAAIRKQELDIIKQVNSLRMQELDTMQEGLDAELDYLETIGASYSRMLDIQGEMVNLSRERYNVEQETLMAMKQAGATGQTLLEQETKVRKSWFDLQKRSLGVQKGVMDKILGAAFGQLRASAGARTGVGTVQQLMGVKGTRVYTAAGLPMGAAPGQGGTVEERSIMRQLKGVGGAAPRKLSAEEKLAKAMRGTEDASSKTAKWTEETADATGNINDRASRRGSLFTHDEGLHSLMAGLLAVAKEMAIALSDDVDAASNIEDAVKTAQIQAHTDSELHENKMGEVAKNTKDTAENTVESAKGTRGTASGIQETRGELQANLKELESLREQQKNTPKDQKDALGEIATKIAELENAISQQAQSLVGAQQAYRAGEISNPFGGMARGARIPGYEDIMAGKTDPLVKEAAAALGKISDEEAQRGSREEVTHNGVRSQGMSTVDASMSGSPAMERALALAEQASKSEVSSDAVDSLAKAVERGSYGKQISDRLGFIRKDFSETGTVSAGEAEMLASDIQRQDQMRRAKVEAEEKRKADAAASAAKAEEFRKKYKIGGFGEPTRLEDFKMDSRFDQPTRLEDFKVGKTMGSGIGQEMAKQKDADKVAIAREVGRTRMTPEGATTFDQYAAKAAAGELPATPGAGGMGVAATAGATSTEQMMESRMMRPEDAPAQVSTMAAHVATPGEGTTGGGAALQIRGELTIRSTNPLLDGSFAQMVARVINTPEVSGEVNRLLQVSGD